MWRVLIRLLCQVVSFLLELLIKVFGEKRTIYIDQLVIGLFIIIPNCYDASCSCLYQSTFTATKSLTTCKDKGYILVHSLGGFSS